MTPGAAGAVKDGQNGKDWSGARKAADTDSRYGGDRGQSRPRARAKPTAESEKEQEEWARDLKQQVQSEMQRERKNRMKRQEKKQKMQEKDTLKKIEEKKTYPLQMSYYEPAKLAIFALVTREIQIHELSQTGGKYKFTHV